MREGRIAKVALVSPVAVAAPQFVFAEPERVECVRITHADGRVVVVRGSAFYAPNYSSGPFRVEVTLPNGVREDLRVEYVGLPEIFVA
jgi:hypothetical protein